VFGPGHEDQTLADYGDDADLDLDVASLLERVDMTDPENLWSSTQICRVEDKKVLDSFMSGGRTKLSLHTIQQNPA